MDFSQFIANNSYLALLAAVPLVIAGQTWWQVRRMSEPKNMFELLPRSWDSGTEQMLSPYQGWLAANDFIHVATFRFGAVLSVTYQQRNTQRFFSFYFHQRRTFSVETVFDDDACCCLETSTSGSVGMFPQRPHQYQQSFPNAAPEEAWKRHLEAEAYLMERFGLKFRPLTMPFEQMVLKDLRLRMNFVRSIPFYPFLALYWFAVSRFRMRNRSIQQQFPRSQLVNVIS